MLKNKLGVISIFSVILLLAVGTAFGLYLFVFSESNFSIYLTEVEEQSNVGDIEIIGIKSSGDYASVIGVRNKGTATQNIKLVNLGGQECNVVSSKIVGNVNNLEVDCAVDRLENYQIELITDKGIYSSVQTVWDESEKQVILPFMRTFDFGNICVNSTKVYGMNYSNNSHAELANESNYFYSLCVKHETFNLGSNCFGNHVTLFSLADTTNSPIYINKADAAPEPVPGYYNWQDVCLSSDAGTFDLRYQPSRPTRDEGFFICLGSFDRDDYNGAHIGGCSMYNEKIWVALE